MRIMREIALEFCMRSLIAAAALLSVAAVAHAEDVTMDTGSGQTISYQLYTYSVSTCSSEGQFRTKILDEPAHGRLDVRPATFVVDKPPCTGRKFVGTSISYTSDKGFRGTDHFSVSAGYPVDGSEMRYSYSTYDFTVNVH